MLDILSLNGCQIETNGVSTIPEIAVLACFSQLRRHTRVCHTETSVSALEKLNAIVCGKKFSNFLQLFFWGIFPYVFGKMPSFPLVSHMFEMCSTGETKGNEAS